MRILELSLSPAYGGLEIHIVDFCSWLAQQSGIELHTCLGNDTPIARNLKDLHLPGIQFDNTAGKFPVIMARALAKYIDKNKIDILHMHWKDDLPLASLAKRMAKHTCRLVHTRHMLLPGSKHDLYHRMLYKPVDKYITITRDLKEQAEKNLPLDHKQIDVIYYGIRAPKILSSDEIAALKQRFKIDHKFTVGLIGRICQEKKQHMLIQAVKQLKDQDIHINAIIVGAIMTDDYMTGLQQYVSENNLESSVHFSGFFEHPTDLMQCFDVLIMPSGVETFGLVLIEGMYCGIPVIGSDKGGVPEIIDHGTTGLMFESDNLQSLVEMILRLYHDRTLRTQLAQAGKSKAERMFVLDQQYNKVLTAFRNLM
jgi:glycosyltransferase involved in cell wall biosynthesis